MAGARHRTWPDEYRLETMDLREIAPQLWWWTAPHPDWTPAAFKDGKGWKEDVSSYALVADGAFVLFDPLIPKGEEQAFWAAVDRDVEHHGSPAILITVYWHVRSSQVILERYEGSTLWAHEPVREEMEELTRCTDLFKAGDALPGGVEAVTMHHMDEAAFWLPVHKSLVLGDSVVGYDGRAELAPSGWLRKHESVDEQRASVQRALELRPERLLLTHGGPTDPSTLEV
jgi:glyoxylase-like metal-dependent hydrolase (beta-lactamase superfamily II)